MCYDVIVVGAGAAGLMCAIEAGKRGRRVLVLEHTDEPGKKILISGGGRCNFTNLHCRPENFISSNPHFTKSALARYTPQDFLSLVKKHRISFHEKTLGQLFCDRNARDMTAMLLTECQEAGVRLITGCQVGTVRKTDEFQLLTNQGVFSGASLVVATGGLSIPKMGATPYGYTLARQFGLRIVDCWPALVPLTWREGDATRYGDLAGVSTSVFATSGSQSFREKLLFTHRGLSGPAVLQISSYWRGSGEIAIDLLPGRDAAAELRARKGQVRGATLRSVLSEWLPNRLADRFGSEGLLTSWSNAKLDELAANLHSWRITPAGTEGYEKAEVTAGGVDTNELSSQTMESRRVPGLYFIGEVVDVTGHLGGFNFQWAWASGYAAGLVA